MRHNLFHALPLDFNVLADDSVGTHPQRQTDDQTEQSLTDKLVDGAQTVLRDAQLDVVVGKAESAEPDRGEEHHEHVDVAQTSQQQAGHEGGNDDDDTAHGGHADLVHPEGVDGRVALGLAAAPGLHPLDEVLAEPHRDEQAQHQGEHCAEGDVVPQVGSRHSVLS